MNPTDIRPFIPARDLNTSKVFYESLGFTGDNANEELVLLSNDHCTFFLYQEGQANVADNLMFQLIVPDIKQAMTDIEGIVGVDFKYEPIKQEHWGKVIYLWGPSGEMWHVTELVGEQE